MSAGDFDFPHAAAGGSRTAPLKERLSGCQEWEAFRIDDEETP
jgi:hypothetical protein